jgi:hypothetical protein
MAKKIKLKKPYHGDINKLQKSSLLPKSSGVLQSPEYKRLIKILKESIVKGRSDAEFFRIFLECSWALLKGDPEYFKKTLDEYTFEEGQIIGKAFNAYVECADRFIYEDILGLAFMEIDAKSVKAGQYFTPMPIAEMMARMFFNPEDFDKEERITIHDPAVGSGIMLLAFAKVVHQELGLYALTKINLSGQDIDRRCVLMTKIQLRIYGLDTFGRLIRLSNGLSNPFNKPKKKKLKVKKTKRKLKIKRTKGRTKL